MTPEYKKDLVLVGGGHAHALVLKMIAMKKPLDTRTTLVSLDDFSPYSGMLPGLLAGHYEHEQAHIDLRLLCAKTQTRFIRAEVTGIDPQHGELIFTDRPTLRFDCLSIDIGSSPDTEAVPGAAQFTTPVKPIYSFNERWQECLAQVNEQRAQVVLVGGGAGSFELALAMRHAVSDSSLSLTLVCGDSLLPGYSQRTRALARAALSDARISLLEAKKVDHVTEGTLHFIDGSQLQFERAFWCTQARGSRWLADSGFDCDSQGFLKVGDTLQLLNHDNIFAAGDVASQVNHPRPKAGVFAVRQAPALAYNLSAKLEGRPLKRFVPQKKFLSMLSLGDKRAIAEKGAFVFNGDWVWRWKDRIDSRFMGQFESLPMSMALPSASDQNAMHCGGCGAKLPAVELRSVLDKLAKDYPDVVSLENLSDDAVRIPANRQGDIYQTVDVLREFLDDPWLMGRIAMLHAMSDLYAMAIKPEAVLAQITLPFAERRLQTGDLINILSGACFELQEAGAQLLGGHTLEGAELSVGFSVSGIATQPAIAKTGLAAGQKLVLTKALGTGVLLAAHGEGRARGDWMSSAIESMLESNATAADLASSHGVVSMTDVTGFGVMGHLAEMLSGSDMHAILRLGQIPLLPGAKEAISAGIASTLEPGNRAFAEPLLLGETPDSAQQRVLYDPQTSGGLLLAVDEAEASTLVENLVAAGYSYACVIGEVNHSDRGAGISLEH